MSERYQAVINNDNFPKNIPINTKRIDMLTFNERVNIGINIIKEKLARYDPSFVQIKMSGTNDPGVYNKLINDISELKSMSLVFRLNNSGPHDPGGASIHEISPGKFAEPQTSWIVDGVYKNLDWPFRVTLEEAFQLKLEHGYTSSFWYVQAQKLLAPKHTIVRKSCFVFLQSDESKIFIDALTKEVVKR
ncbi:hypothetical protein [Xenorhabdus sp. PB30.3]|uniref:hypothetical protein n=1 Tax=Xenorhabdus sp. PB30.3 TaxID=2788941 RepID=UPI001E4CED05|nr:hypothetical protein [Xenorhabdus sp. PB30.3]MCC8378590.1 hypothetical protein [Xenorhabdus sp. PB30.3]